MNEGLHIAAGIDENQPLKGGLKTLAQFEREYIEFIIHISQDNIPRAAQILDVAPSTLYRKRAQWACTRHVNDC